MSSSRRKPDFLVIGVQKSATTWLQERLRQHPDIFMPRDELHFFDRESNFAKGEDWYLDHFSEAEDYQLIGEKTPDYIWTNIGKWPGMCATKHERIYAFNNDFKLISVFREPVARFLSAFHHNCRLGRLPTKRSIAEMERNPDHAKFLKRMRDQGLYATQLTDFLKYFDKDQIKVLFHDDVSKNPDGTLAEVQAFLGVKPQAATASNAKRYNDFKATEFGASLLSRTTGNVAKLVMRLDRHIFSKLPIEKVGYPKLSAEEEADLRNFYAAEMARFVELIGKPLPDDWGY